MSIEAITKQVAIRSAANITGLKAAYASDYSSVVGQPAAVPEDITDGPIAIVLIGGSDADTGNAEQEVHDFVVLVWVPAPAGSTAAAYKTLVPFALRYKAEFRQDQDNAGTARRVWYRGYREPIFDDTYGKPFLVMRIEMSAAEDRFTDDNTI